MRNAPPDLVALCEQEHPRMVRALDLWSGDLDLAEAVAEDALVRLWRRWASVRRLDRRVEWLYEAALDLVLDRRATPSDCGRRAERRLVVAGDR